MQRRRRASSKAVWLELLPHVELKSFALSDLVCAALGTTFTRGTCSLAVSRVSAVEFLTAHVVAATDVEGARVGGSARLLGVATEALQRGNVHFNLIFVKWFSFWHFFLEAGAGCG